MPGFDTFTENCPQFMVFNSSVKLPRSSTFIFSGIAVGSSPLYPAIATLVFIPGILLVIAAAGLRRKYSGGA